MCATEHSIFDRFCFEICAEGPLSNYYDVIGVVGMEYSSFAIAACQVLGPARVPVISYYATSDDLSDKTKFPYFLRVVPPDRWLYACLPLFCCLRLSG